MVYLYARNYATAQTSMHCNICAGKTWLTENRKPRNVFFFHRGALDSGVSNLGLVIRHHRGPEIVLPTKSDLKRQMTSMAKLAELPHEKILRKSVFAPGGFKLRPLQAKQKRGWPRASWPKRSRPATHTCGRGPATFASVLASTWALKGAES